MKILKESINLTWNFQKGEVGGKAKKLLVKMTTGYFLVQQHNRS